MQIKFFGYYRALAGVAEVEITIGGPIPVSRLKELLVLRFPHFGEVFGPGGEPADSAGGMASLFMLDGRALSDQAEVKEGDVLQVLPLVSGG